MKEPIGLNAANGQPILEGDIVEFRFDADNEHDEVASNGTLMRDVVVNLDNTWFFIEPDLKSGAFAYRFADRCTVVGNIYSDDCDLMSTGCPLLGIKPQSLRNYKR